MKKFLLLILMVLMAFTQVDARWDLGEQISASQLKDGDSIIMEYVASKLFASRYLTVDENQNTGMLGSDGQLNDNHIWVVEEGPLDVRTGATTFYFRHLATGRYMKADGGYSAPFSTAESIDQAANWQVASCGEDMPFSNCIPFEGNGDHLKDGESGDKIVNWGVNGDGQGAVTDNSVGLIYSKSEKSWAYLTCYWGTISYTGLQMCNQWNLFKAEYTKDKISDLSDLIDLYAEFAPQGGTTPGYYAIAATEAYNNAMEEAVQMLFSGASDEEIDDMILKLKTTKKACEESVIPITPGYYYIVSGYDAFLNAQNQEMAVYPNANDDLIYWKALDQENGDFVWYIEPAAEANQFYVQHYFTNKWAGQINSWTGTSATTSMITTKSYPQRITQEVEGMFLWSDIGYTYPTQSNGKSPFTTGANGETTSGKLVAWGRTSDANDKKYIFEEHTNLWYIRPVSEEVMQALAPQKEQMMITMQLSELIDEGTDLYNKLFSYSTDFSEGKGLIKRANGGIIDGEMVDPDETAQISFSHINKQGIDTADKYEFLIDGDSVTYMQGTGYISLKLDEPKQVITFTYKTRGGTEQQQTWGFNERPKMVNLYAANLSAGDTEYGDPIYTNVDMSSMEPVTINFGRPVDRIAYQVSNNFGNGNNYTFSEFQIYAAEVDEATSQYHTTEGLSQKADALQAMMTLKKAIVSANSATATDVEELKEAIAQVRELYADTTELAGLIAQSETLLQGIEVGEGMGQLTDGELATALQGAVSQAKAALEGAISVAAVKSATAALVQAKASFLNGIKSFEVGKWYFITNLDTERLGADGAADAYCGGSAIYLNDKYNGGSVTKWGLFDQNSQTLNADNNPKAMWRFVPVEGTEYYAIQNMYSGYYLGDFAGKEINMPVSQLPVPYEIAYSGHAQFLLYPRGGANTENYALYPEGYEKDVVCHEAIPGTASAWTFIEIDPEEQEAISISDFAFNLIDVMAVPYNVSNLADYNDDVHTYAIRKMTQEEGAEGVLVTTVELYEKSEFEAGEPFIIVLGSTDADVECEPYDLLIPFPTDVVDHTVPMIKNGIVGGLHTITFDHITGVSTGKVFKEMGAGGGFDSQTGVIDVMTYKGEVEGETTALTLVIEGLPEIPAGGINGDVDGDGKVNTADVVAVYNVILGTAPASVDGDVDGDGKVNTADVVAVYNIILGGGAKSPVFKAQTKKFLK